MKREFDDQSWRAVKRGSARKSNGKVASVKNGDGDLIHFATLARAATAQIEIEKSLRELTLQMNRTQQAEHLQIGMRLHDVLDRSIALKKPYLAVLTLEPGLRRPG
jgi:hypothetical protein